MAKKQKKNEPQRKRIKFEVNADIDQTRFLKVYTIQCSNEGSAQCPWLVQAMKKGIADRAYTRKFQIEPAAPVPEGLPPALPVNLDPILSSIRKAHYHCINELCVWDIELKHSAVANLALLIEKGVYPIYRLELMDCDILYYSVERLARTFKISNLSEINLDYNEFGDEGCIRLCNGCKNNKTILILSLCYCGLTKNSGIHLGEVAFSSAIREFYLDGNRLECQGVANMIRAVAVAAEAENAQRIEEEKLKALMMMENSLNVTDKNMATQMENASGAETDKNNEGKPKKKKKKKGKKKKKEPDPPVVGPYIHKLHLADNGVDPYCKGREDTLFSCIGIIARFIMYSWCLCELDLDDNPIGNLAAREIMEALARRKEGNLPDLKMIVTAEMQKDTFSAIMKLASGLQKKKKKGKKKKKTK